MNERNQPTHSVNCLVHNSLVKRHCVAVTRAHDFAALFTQAFTTFRCAAYCTFRVQILCLRNAMRRNKSSFHFIISKIDYVDAGSCTRRQAVTAVRADWQSSQVSLFFTVSGCSGAETQGASSFFLVKVYNISVSNTLVQFLANVNVSSRSLYVVVRPSVVCL